MASHSLVPLDDPPTVHKFVLFFLLQFNNRFGGGDCKVCTLGEYMSKSNSGVGGSVDVGDMRQDYWTVSNLLQQARVKGSEVRAQQKMMESMSFNMADTYTRTKHELNETFQVFASIVEERKQQLLRELEADYTQKRMVIKQHIEQRQETVTRLFQVRRHRNSMDRAGLIFVHLFSR